MLRTNVTLISATALCLSLSGCSMIYKLPTRQGNVIEQKQLDQLKLGMTHEQVKFLMGTPIATSAYADNRWDYFGYYKSPRGQISRRTVSLYFAGDKLTQMDGIELASNEAKALDQPDVDALIKQQKRDPAADAAAGGKGGVSVPGNLPAGAGAPGG